MIFFIYFSVRWRVSLLTSAPPEIDFLQWLFGISSRDGKKVADHFHQEDRVVPRDAWMRERA
jgi:hypothetical protein